MHYGADAVEISETAANQISLVRSPMILPTEGSKVVQRGLKVH